MRIGDFPQQTHGGGALGAWPALPAAFGAAMPSGTGQNAADSASSATNEDRLTLSEAAQQLRAHPFDLSADQSLLQRLTMQSLASSGALSSEDLKNARISFDHIAVAEVSTASASMTTSGSNSLIDVQGADAESLLGSGTITLSNGQTYHFNTELDTAVAAEIQSRSQQPSPAPHNQSATSAPAASSAPQSSTFDTLYRYAEQLMALLSNATTSSADLQITLSPEQGTSSSSTSPKAAAS